jgi:4-amino-4-deoxychorismate lyase
MGRLREGCRRLAIPCPEEPGLLDECLDAASGMDRGVVKIILTRGPGGRGYRVPEDPHPTRIIQCHYPPGYAAELAEQGVSVCLCEQRLGWNPLLAGIKHLNRLEQVLARQEWTDAEIMEGLQRDIDGNLIEGTMSNLFLVKDRSLFTPDLSRCGVAGIMRSVVMELAGKLSVPVCKQVLAVADMQQADEVFLTNSLIGIWPVAELDGVALGTGPLTRKLQKALRSLQAEGETWYA